MLPGPGPRKEANPSFKDMVVTEGNVHDSSSSLVQYIKNIDTDTLRKMVLDLEPLLSDIKEMKTSNRRHHLFHSSLNDRATLNMKVSFTVFTEIQMHVITSTLLEIFKDSPSLLTLDYIMKVLLPETMVMILSKTGDISYTEAENILDNNF